MYLCDFDETHLETHKREIQSLYRGVEVHTRRFDAADEEAVKGVINDALSRYGRLDVFFANAGIVGVHASFTDIDEQNFMQTLRVNTLGLVLPPTIRTYNNMLVWDD